MDKIDLIRVRDKTKEIGELERMIRQSEEKIVDLYEEIQSDTVTGSRPDLTFGAIKVTGIPEVRIERIKGRIKKRREKIEKLREEIEEAEEYISRIKDPRARRVVRMRCETDMNWEEIAEQIGGKATGESCRKIFERTIKTGQIAR